jgi:hypothetical protein
MKGLMMGYNTEDDKALCEAYNIEPFTTYGDRVDGINGYQEEFTTYHAVLSSPTPDTEAMVRDATHKKFDNIYSITTESYFVATLGKVMETTRIEFRGVNKGDLEVDGELDTTRALAADKLRKV